KGNQIELDAKTNLLANTANKKRDLKINFIMVIYGNVGSIRMINLGKKLKKT
ncbi:MAG: hypothetical protein RLZ39_1713, partial [Bacteroidota bacterium]